MKTTLLIHLALYVSDGKARQLARRTLPVHVETHGARIICRGRPDLGGCSGATWNHHYGNMRAARNWWCGNLYKCPLDLRDDPSDMGGHAMGRDISANPTPACGMAREVTQGRVRGVLARERWRVGAVGSADGIWVLEGLGRESSPHLPNPSKRTLTKRTRIMGTSAFFSFSFVLFRLPLFGGSGALEMIQICTR